MSRVQKIKAHWQPAFHADIAGPVFLFPGQGTAMAGFLADVKDLSAIRTRMAIAEHLANERGIASPSDYSFSPQKLDGDERARATNIALFSAQVALCEAFVEYGIRPVAMTAHSFGEFAMLVCTGVLTFEQLFDYVTFRESLLPPANERGYLLALHSPVEEFTDLITPSGATLTHRNSPSETVFALSWDRLVDLENALRARGARFTRLTIPQPFHSARLHDLATKMRAFVETQPWEYQVPRVPFFSSVAHQWVNAKNFSAPLIKEILSLQLVRPVNFTAQIKAMELLASSYVELGVRPLLAHFISEITHSKRTVIHRPTELSRAESRSSSAPSLVPHSRVIEAIQQAVEKITGYRLENISLEDRFQEDLGLDSIKTTEVIVEVFDRLDTPALSPWKLQGVRSLQELLTLIEAGKSSEGSANLGLAKPTHFAVYAPDWKTAPLTCPPRKVGASRCFEVIPEQLPSLATLPQGSEVILRFGSEYWNDFRGHEPIAILQWFSAELCGKRLRLALLFHGEPTPIARALIGLVKSLRKENLFNSVKFVHVAAHYSKADALLLAQVEAAIPETIEVSYHGGERSIPYRTPVEFSSPSRVVAHRILALGGHSGITLSLLKSLTPDASVHIDLVGRSDPQAAAVKAAVEKLEACGATVHYHSLDVSDEIRLCEWIASLPVREYDLVINGVGAERSQPFLEKSPDDWRFELDAKWQGALNLLSHLSELTVGHFVQFSSIIAREGNSGQSVYAFAGAWSAEVIASHFPAAQVSVIEWPPWDGVGMTSQRGVKERLKLSGVSLLPEARAHELFQKILQRPPSPSTVLVADLQDQWLFELSLLAEDSFPAALGKPAFSLGPGTFLSLLIPQQDECLSAHQFAGRFVLPAAAGIMLMETAGRFFINENVTHKDFSIARPLHTVSSPLLLELQCRGGGNEGGLVLGNAWRANLSGDFAWPEPLALTENFAPTPGPYYGDGGLFHTGNFQVIDHILRGSSNGWRARGRAKRLSGLPFAEADSELVTMLDGAFQLLAWAAFQETGVWHLPAGATSITLRPMATQKPTSPEFEISARPVSASEKIRVSDFDILFSGERVAAVRGAQMQPVTPRLNSNA